MPPTKPPLDLHATHLVAVVTAQVSTDLGLKRPSASALGEMFVRVRERLAELGGAAPIEELAPILSLTIYLTWQAEADAPDSQVLAPLKEQIERVLRG